MLKRSAQRYPRQTPVARASLYLLGLLMAVNLLNYADRTLIAVLAEPIKADLHLSDTQMGAASGLAFALMFSLSGLLLAHWSDRYSPKWVLCGAISFWTAMCVMSASARSFGQLFAMRLALGVGESGAAPASYAIIHRSFDGFQRSFAYSLFIIGGTLGIGTGLTLGGWLGEELGWRRTVLIMSVPGIVLAALVAFTINEREHQNDIREEQNISAIFTIVSIARDPFRRSLVLAHAFVNFSYGAFGQWMPAFFMRAHSMTLREVGSIYSTIAVLGALLGLAIGGAVVGKLQQADPRRALLLCGALNVVAAVACIVAFSVGDRSASLISYALFNVATGATFGPTIAMFQDKCETGTHAMSSAVMMLIVIIVGQGAGPFVAGVLSDVFHGLSAANPLGKALLICSVPLAVSCVNYVRAAGELTDAKRASPSQGDLSPYPRSEQSDDHP
jgi:MFS family permease